MIKVRRPARTLLQLLNAREKVFRPQGIFSVPEKVPSPACRFRVAEEVTGFCIFKPIWSGPAERSGDGALDYWSRRQSSF
jgi:hypothetical protein